MDSCTSCAPHPPQPPRADELPRVACPKCHKLFISLQRHLRFCAPELHQQPDVDSLSPRSAGGPVETVEHVLFECAALRPPSLLGWSSLPLAQRRAAMNAAATVVFVREVLSRLSPLAPPTSPSLPSCSTSSTPAPFAVGELPYCSPPASSSRTATPTPSQRLTPPRAPARSTFLGRRGAFSA